jgi:transcriptional regulator with XRE-family HTH domain
MTTFSRNLKFLRKERKLSQQQVADSVGIKQRAYSDYENAKSEPTVSTLNDIAIFFRTSLDMLVGVALDIALNKEDRAFVKELSSNTQMGNTELVGEVLLQAAEFGVSKVARKEPRIFNEELVEQAKVINNAKQ